MTSPPPLTREDSLAHWRAFLPLVPSYAAHRNHIEDGHHNISHLSVALRHRLLTEDEVIQDTLRTHGFHQAEKWLQEVCWRRYWKGWLEARPDVWTSWQRRVRELRTSLPPATLAHADRVASGNSGVACMDAIARELIETGYLHNHARMWWASFWIHAERLPWELGAECFYRHLLDADPASNTLSWRWVAGLQTPGKTYLVRLSNLKKYASPSILADLTGSARIADDAVSPVLQPDFADTSKHPLPTHPSAPPVPRHRFGIWLHPDDLSPESGPLAALKPTAVICHSAELEGTARDHLSSARSTSLRTVLHDAAARATSHFACPAQSHGEHITSWAESYQIREIIAFAPRIGPELDSLPALIEELNARDITLSLVRRPSDHHADSIATAGFFPFWKHMSRHLQQLES